MRTRHRKKAIAGVSCWFTLLLSLAVLILFRNHLGERRGAFIWLNAVALTICYFWGSYQLAKAKGYSVATVLAGILGPPAQLAMMTALLVMRDKHSGNPAPRVTKKQPKHRESNIGRAVRFRRNAVVGIAFGLGGIVVGVFLVLFNLGMFEDFSNQTVLGIFAFFCGYCGVIAGCWWWVKAKELNDAIVFIGLMPLAAMMIAFIFPYARFIFVLAPTLLPISMLMMPIILLVVVFVLPDKSGWEGRKRWRQPTVTPAGARSAQMEDEVRSHHS